MKSCPVFKIRKKKIEEREKWNTLREGAPEQPSRERAIRSQAALTTTGGGASERSDEPWDLRLLLGASDPISSGDGIEKNPLLCL